MAGDDCIIEFEQKKIDLNAYINGKWPSQLHWQKFYIIRIGKTLEELPRKIEAQISWDVQLLTAPPGLSLLRITQQSFRRIVDQYLWEYSIENDDVDEKDSGSDINSPLLCPPPPEASTADKVVNTTPAKKKQKLNKVKVGALDGDDISRLFPNFVESLV